MFIPSGFMNVPALLKRLRIKSEDSWVQRGEQRALGLFHAMAKRVPAYKDFLKKHGVRSAAIKRMVDFRNLPTIDKNNYLRAYPLEQLCWDGELRKGRWTISTTSGSTGEPFFFPRQIDQDWQYAIMAEMYLLTNFNIDKKSTLYIDAFPLGPWIGGIFTYEAIRLVAERGKYPLSVYTAGINKQEIIKAVKKFGHLFDQIIIGCYGPFLKDALDDGVNQGVRWSDYNMRFVFSAEGFSEEFRDYVLKVSGLSNDPYTTSLNHYGTVDLGTMAHETPLSILARRLAVAKRPLYNKVFGDVPKLPTFTQYIPELFFFEEVNNGLLCSGYSGLPLVRYDLKDHGGVKTFGELLDIYTQEGIDLRKEANRLGLQKTVWNLPFVYVYERNDFSVSLYAFLIYPDTVRRALQHPTLERLVTGKFTMMVKYDDKMDQYFEVHAELKAVVGGTVALLEQVQKIITNKLLEESSEFQKTHSELGNRIEPRIIFWPYEDPTFFRPGIKQQWVKKT